MNLRSIKKIAIAGTGVFTAFITFHIAIAVARHLLAGEPITGTGMIAGLALLMGVQNIILALWCYEHVRREERVLEMYPEVRHG